MTAANLECGSPAPAFFEAAVARLRKRQQSCRTPHMPAHLQMRARPHGANPGMVLISLRFWGGQ